MLLLLAALPAPFGCLVDLPSPRPAADAAASAPVYVQGDGTADDSFAATIGTAFPRPNIAGNLIVIAASWGGTNMSDVETSPADSLGNTYALITRKWDPMFHQGLGIWYVANITGGSNTVTVSFNPASSYRRIAVHEYAGVASVSPLDAMASQLSTSATPTSTQATTEEHGELVFGAVVTTTMQQLISAGEGFELRQTLPLLGTEDRIQASAGPVAATFVLDAASEYLCQMATFEAGAAP